MTRNAVTSSAAPVFEKESLAHLFAELLAVVNARWRGLPDKPEETPDGTVRALWFAAAGCPCSVESALETALPALEEKDVGPMRLLLEQWLSGVPLAYLTGRQRFMGLEFETDPSALIPRKETEILGSTALELLHQLARERGQVKLMDLCTGSGNLAIGLTSQEPACHTFAADICSKAISLARRNARTFKLEGRIDFRVGDLFAPFADGSFDGQIDLMVCNPPYISSAKVATMPREISAFEPLLAFDAGAFGFSVLGRLIKEAPRYLKVKSWLCFEVGLGQGPYLASTLERMKEYSLVRKVSNPHGEVRTVVART